MVKKIILIMITLVVVFQNSYSFFGSNKKPVLKIGVNSKLNKDLIDYISKNYLNEEFSIESVLYEEKEKLNIDLIDKRIDANYFQTRSELDAFNKENKNKLVSLGEVYSEKIGIYSTSLNSIREINGKIAISNNKVTVKRSLELLEETGLITLDTDGKIKRNTREIEVIQVAPKMIERLLGEVDAVIAVIDDLNIDKEKLYENAIYLEKNNSNYKKLLVSKKNSKKEVYLERLKEILLNSETERYLKSKYGDIIVSEE